MLEKDGLLNDLLSGQTIRGISCRTGSAEFQCDDGRSLTLYALPDVYFQPDDVSERLADAPLPQKLRALIGQRIMSVRADGMGLLHEARGLCRSALRQRALLHRRDGRGYERRAERLAVLMVMHRPDGASG